MDQDQFRKYGYFEDEFTNKDQHSISRLNPLIV